MDIFSGPNKENTILALLAKGKQAMDAIQENPGTLCSLRVYETK